MKKGNFDTRTKKAKSRKKKNIMLAKPKQHFK